MRSKNGRICGYYLHISAFAHKQRPFAQLCVRIIRGCENKCLDLQLLECKELTKYSHNSILYA